jgi:hypothetical protein
MPPLGGPWPAPGEQLWEVRLEHAELVVPRVAHDPEVKAALLLVVITGRAERFQALDLGLHIVGFQVEVHSFLGDLLVIGALKQHPDLGVRESQASVDVALAGRPHNRDALVFTAPMGGPLSRADFVRNYFKPAVRAANEAIAGLPKDHRPSLLPEGLRFYGLRHTCASLLIAQGASVKAVQAQLGHATASITLDTYGHLFPSEMEALANRLELVRDAALAKRGRTQHGPAGSRLRETAGG